MLAALRKLPLNCSYLTADSPVGTLWLIASPKDLCALLMKTDLEEHECREMFASLKFEPEHPVLKETCRQLSEYFRGERREFDLPLAPIGTEFQMQAWNILREIPYGRTISYREQAQAMGDAKKARAVGTANSRNPLSIIVPCHRVVASSGALSGFGGGVENKRYLLDLEEQTSRS